MDKLSDAPTVRPTHQAILNLGNEVSFNRKFMIGGVFLVIAFSAATFGLTLGAAEFAKDTTVSSKGALVSKTTDHELKTASVEKVLIPISPATSLATLADLANVVVARRVDHSHADESVEVLKKVVKTKEGYTITTAEGEYSAPTTVDGIALYYSGEASPEVFEQLQDGQDKRANLCKIINGVAKCSGQNLPGQNAFDTCMMSDEGDKISECCSIDVPGLALLQSDQTTGVCEYTCTKWSSIWPQSWVPTAAEDCGFGCCKDATCTQTKVGFFGGGGSGSGTGECGPGNTMYGNMG